MTSMTSMTTPSGFQTRGIFGIYLAAGKSSRMGCHKLSLPVAGTSLGSVALQTALRSELDGVLVVTRPDDMLDWLDPAMRTAPLREKWRQLFCSDASQGQGYSLRCGLQRAQDLQARAVVVLLADQPFVSVEMINHLLQTFRDGEGQQQPLDYVASSHQGLLQPPILFSHTLFPLLLTLQGDEGARRIIRVNDGLHGTCIEFANARLFQDVDTPFDYETLSGM
jgi:molybdenum cofactor cytidylyltransferase